MTRAELRELVLDFLDDAQGTYFTPAIVNRRLNLAMRELQKDLISANKQYYCRCVTTQTIVNQQLYALPSDFMQLLRLRYVSGGAGVNQAYIPIVQITPNQVSLRNSTTGDPSFYFLQKNNLSLTPIPNRVVTLELLYSYLVQDMADDSSEPDAPEQFHEYISVLAARDGYLKDGRSIAPIETKLEQYRMLLKQIANQRMSDQPRMIVETQGTYYGL